VTLRYDALVAGSGAGGAAVAGRLAAGGMKVLLLERGGPARAGPSAVAAVRRHYARGGLGVAFGPGLLPVPTGSGVGGTTAINSGTCLRPPADLVAGWERATPGFSAAAFSRNVEEAWGALKVKQAPLKTLSGSSRLVLEGFRRLGILAEPLHRAEDGCAGEGRCCFVCPRGAKMTSDKAFLDPLPAGARPELWTRSELTGLSPGRGASSSVRAVVRRGGVGERVEAGLAVLACGALETPNLVRALRLGPAWRRAGDGLSLHPAAKLFGLFPERVLPADGVPQGVGAVHPSDPRVRLEGVATPPELTALTMPLEGARLRWWMERRARLATFGLMVKDEARGSVRAPFGRAWPLVRYAPTEGDLKSLARGIGLAARALFAAGAEQVLLPLNRRRNAAWDPFEASELLSGGVTARELQGMAFHPLGTCAMGRVVGADLRLAPGVYVCDGSVVPESLGVNPQVTIYAFALGLAGRLLGRAEGA
jgi:choline dehydrogenase-like flavoprotein